MNTLYNSRSASGFTLALIKVMWGEITYECFFVTFLMCYCLIYLLT